MDRKADKHISCLQTDACIQCDFNQNLTTFSRNLTILFLNVSGNAKGQEQLSDTCPIGY
jgi:hypothetical protein